MNTPLTIWALDGIGEVQPGDDVAQLTMAAVEASGAPLADGDILVISSKIISKAEGRIVSAPDREAAIDAETMRVVASRELPDGRVMRIVENRLGIVGAAAGVDASNTAAGTVLLLPTDPDASARRIAQAWRKAGVRVGVIISDTLGRPWRDGQIDVAIGAGGVHVFEDLAGKRDPEGHELRATRPCVADELASAAELVKGKLGRRPVAVIRGAGRFVGSLDLPGARSINRDSAADLFRLGTAEAHAAGYAEGLAAHDHLKTADQEGRETP